MRYKLHVFDKIERRTITRGHNPKFVATIDDKKYYIKYNSEADDRDNVQKNIAEGFVSRVMKKIGVNCVNVELGDIQYNDENDTKVTKKSCLVESYKDKNVVASFTLLEVMRPDDETTPFTNFDKVYCSVQKTLEKLPKYLSKMSDIYSHNNATDANNPFSRLIIDTNLTKDLINQCIVDYMFANDDRHEENVEFLIVKEDNYYVLKVAPMFDNGKSLGLQVSESKAADMESADYKYNIFANICDYRYSISYINQRETVTFNEQCSDISDHFQSIAYTDEDFCFNDLNNNANYHTYRRLKDMDINKELSEYLSLVGGIENGGNEVTQDLIDAFNSATGLTLTLAHAHAVVGTFGARKAALTHAMQDIDAQYDKALEKTSAIIPSAKDPSEGDE